MKKIVILSAFLSPFRSGAEACAEEVALRLSDRFDITIITARLRKDLPKYDRLQGKVPVIRVGFGIPFDKWLYPFLAPFAARKLKPDVLHAVLETFAGLALHACTMIVPRAKQILTLQTTNRNFLRRHILRTPDIVTAISKYLVEQAKQFGRNDVIVIPNGIPYGEIREACEKYQKVPGRILFVGRLEKMKGVDVLLKAFAQIPDAAFRTLHVVGEGSERSTLEGQAQQSKITGQTTFTGRLTGDLLLREYAEAQIFCGLSRSEALGNVFIEAQAAGCAVLATEVGGIPDAVKDGVTGILTEPDNPELTTDVLGELLQNEKIRNTLAAAGVEHARRFDWDAIASAYEKIYG